MIDITYRPLHGGSSISIAGIEFKNGETIAFGDGSNGYTDEDAEIILTNANFIDAELGRNPNYTCDCGQPIDAYAFDPAIGMVRTHNIYCPQHLAQNERAEEWAREHPEPRPAPEPQPEPVAAEEPAAEPTDAQS